MSDMNAAASYTHGIPIQSPVSPLLTSVDRQMTRTNVQSHKRSAQLF